MKSVMNMVVVFAFFLLIVISRCVWQMYCELTEKHIEHEKKMREDIESRLAALKKAEDEDIRALTESVKVERVRSKESVRKLDESVSLLEKQLLEQKRQGDKVMAAEIKSRCVISSFLMCVC